jgi:hypothetical protein
VPGGVVVRWIRNRCVICDLAMDLGCVVVVGMAAAVECAGGVLVFCGFGGIGLVDGLESGGVARTGSGIGV